MIPFVYFISVFCAVYHASQWNWFTNGLTSILLSLSITIGTAFIVTILGYIGLKCNIEIAYNFSIYLSR